MSTVWKVASAILVVIGVVFLVPPIYITVTNGPNPSGFPCAVISAAACFFLAMRIYGWSSMGPADKRRALAGFLGGFAGSIAGLILGVVATIAFVLYEARDPNTNKGLGTVAIILVIMAALGGAVFGASSGANRALNRYDRRQAERDWESSNDEVF
jgi:hypothetical protein